MSWWWVMALVGGLVLGCGQSAAFDAQGFVCATNTDCDATTFCFQNICRPLLDENAKPGPFNTGLPQLAPGESLETVPTLSLNQPNTLVELKDVQGCVTISASHVTFRRSRIRCDAYYALNVGSGADNVLIEDVEIDGRGFIGGSALSGGGFTARRLNIHSTSFGVRLGNSAVVEQSYVHDLVGAGSPGPTAVSSDNGQSVTVKGNTLEAIPSVGRAVLMDNNLSNVRIEENWLNGGEYTLQVRGTGASDFVVSRNRFGRDFAKGSLAVTSGVTTEENVYDDNNEAVPR